MKHEKEEKIKHRLDITKQNLQKLKEQDSQRINYLSKRQGQRNQIIQEVTMAKEEDN